MAKTISEENYKKVSKFVVEQVEPRIQKIVDAVNDHFKKDGVRVGVELKWFFDEVEVKENKDENPK
jgi:hypothetical protein